MGDAELSDEALVTRCRASFDWTRETMAVLYQRHRVGLFNFLRRYVGDDHVAEDVLQETFLRVIRGIEQFEPTKRFADWIYTIALNAARDGMRRRKAVSLEPDFAPAMEAGPEERTAIRDEHEKLSRLITDLPEEERAVFILARVEGKPLSEVADVMGFSVRTAKYRLADALEHLTRRMATTEAV